MVTDTTTQQIVRALRKAASKFPAETESRPLTDLYLQVKQESGELMIFDDEEQELTRCVVEEWIGNKDEDFYNNVQEDLAAIIRENKEITENVNILKPFSYVLIDEEKETLAELHLVDDDTILLSGELMKGLEKDLEDFWNKLADK